MRERVAVGKSEGEDEGGWEERKGRGRRVWERRAVGDEFLRNESETKQREGR